jgi:hypothetical protein
MPEKRGKLGDDFIVHLKKGKKKEGEQVAPARRKGPYPTFEEEGRPGGKAANLMVTFLDQQVNFQQSSPRFIPPYRELRWTPSYMPGNAGILPSLDMSTNVRRYSDATTFVTYRQAFDRMPLSFLHAQDYGLSFVLNGTGYSLAPATPQWVERKSPAQRQADLIALDEETGSDHSAEIALLDYEIAEWEAAYETPQTYWNPINLEWSRNYATFEKKLTANSSFAVDCSGQNFESFNPFDTVNFKMTQGDFEDDEVAPSRLRAKVRRAITYDLRIGLIAQRWNFTVQYLAWHYQARFDANPSRVVKHVRNESGSVKATTAPLVDSVFSNVYPKQESEYEAGVFSSITHTSSSTTLTGLPDEANHIIFLLENDNDADGLIPILTSDLDFESSDPPFTVTLIERSDATISITQADSEEGKLVGVFSVAGESFNVYRKTTLSRGGSVYSGPIDAVRFMFSSVDPFFINYVNPQLQSRSRDFTYYDPSNLRDHVTV